MLSVLSQGLNYVKPWGLEDRLATRRGLWQSHVRSTGYLKFVVKFHISWLTFEELTFDVFEIPHFVLPVPSQKE